MSDHGWTVPDDPLEAGPPAPPRKSTDPDRLAYVRLSDVDMKSIRFVDFPLWQESAFHLLVGRKGIGKGTTLADMTARVTRGEFGSKRNVVWIGSEDSAAIDIHPRVVAAGGDPSRVVVVTDWIQLPRDVTKLRDLIDEVGDVGLVIIDPVGNHITGKNSNSDTDIRDAIAPLNDLSDEMGTTLVGVRHLTEKEASAGIIAAILGASAWSQIPRAVIGMARDDEDADVTHIQCVLGNRLPPDTPGRVFRIVGVRLDGLENEVTRVEWIGDSAKDVEKLLGAAKLNGRGVPAADVQRVILDLLAGGERNREELDRACKDALGVNEDTVYKNGLAPLRGAGVIRARKAGMNEGWFWWLTTEAAL